MPSFASSVAAQLVVAGEEAGDAVADLDHVAAHRLAEDQAVEGGHALEIGGADADDLGQHRRNRLVGHPAAVLLHDLERADAGGAAIGVVREVMLDLVALVGGQHEGLGLLVEVGDRSAVRSLSLVGGGALTSKGIVDYTQSALGRAARVGRPRGLHGSPDGAQRVRLPRRSRVWFYAASDPV